MNTAIPTKSLRLFCSAALIIILVSAFFPVHAQTQVKPAEEAPKSPIIKTLPPAYNDQMARLAEILGSIQYLRNLCGAGEGLLWREQMANIIAGEEPIEERKADMISRFNRGFRAYRDIYRECTPSAVEVVNRYMRQGKRLSGEIPNQYGR
ncbi:MAG: TIGR02301 family protein [Rhizobiaceae bacterium]|nr:TIGR02301 family protein [Rhizobiaceae bacterium]